jgi:hypothetical protein
METIEYTFRQDHPQRYNYFADWGAGPWSDEPDKVQWADPATGLPCLVNRNRMGAWCGYVGLPVSHPWRDGNYHDFDVDVHGGLTYGPEPCAETEDGSGICHVTESPDEDDVQWIGFDCHQCYDLSPGMLAYERRHNLPHIDAPWGDNTYKTIEYAKAEATKLAEQIARAIHA